jgi:transcriptional regulator with XRE-family HTH domain
MTNEIDFYVGKRLRRRRRLLGLTQQSLGDMVGIRFQQIQKYECGANRISAARLFELSEALSVPIQYFYEGLMENPHELQENPEFIAPDVLSKKETMDLVRAYYSMGEGPRKHLLDLAKSLEKPGADTPENANLHLVTR